MSFTTIFFDLDETLYPSSNGLWLSIRDRIRLFMQERLDIPANTIPALSERCFRQYGTTLRGLQVNYGVNMEEYLNYVHDIPINNYLKPNPKLKKVIDVLPHRKAILTNADSAHAQRVISALGLDGCFEMIIDVYQLNPYCKPMPESFKIAMSKVGETDPHRCILIDDLPANVRAAKDFGFHAILVDESSKHHAEGDILVSLKDLLSLRVFFDANVK